MASPPKVSPAKALLDRLLDAFPFLKRKLPSAPEPFSSIEDSTPNADVLLSPNAAPTVGRKAGKRVDLRSAVEDLSRNKGLLVVLAAVLGLLLVIAVTAIAVSVPPPKPAAIPALDAQGDALARKWLVPPGSPLEPRMEMERGSAPRYTPADALRLGLDPARVDVAAETAANDAAAEKLFGAVR
ncbi:MAG TPA: hypothetical protein VMV90_12125 [Rectinemataceae bacterium]|nr:hypothetical protein [Rectinemataceae bacterium]